MRYLTSPRGSLLSALVIASMVTSSGTLLAEPKAGLSDLPWLGVYGPSYPITRDELPPGVRTRVSDEAITAANSPAFAVARGAWADDAGFVDQIDYQLVFRGQVDFMSRDYDHLAQLLLDKPRNMGIESMGLFMTSSEVAELRRRDALGDKMKFVVALVTGVDVDRTREGTYPNFGSNFGGIWQDQLDGGKIALAVVDPSVLNVEAIGSVLGGQDRLKIIEQEFSYNQIEEYRGLLDAELGRLGIARDIAAVRNARGRLLEVRLQDPGLLPLAFGAGVPASAYTVVRGSPVQSAGNPTSTHSLADQQPGIEIWVRGGSGCTWGFNGHTSSYHYIVVAGHCLPPPYDNLVGQWVQGNIEIDQNADTSRNLTPGDTFIGSVNNATYDAARIESPYADDNCYHGDVSSPPSHCAWPMANRAVHNSWEIGSDRTCASLGNVASNTYRCGFILEENHVGGNRVRVGMVVHDGDSGAGMKWEYRIDGILTDRSDTEAFFQTAYHVELALGAPFGFNCYSPGSIVRSNPADWGTCPAVDA